jgi:hypothetical protein
VPNVDLNIKFVPEDTRVWRLYPGQYRDFRDPFANTDTVFLDLPSLTLDRDSINDRHLLNAKIGRAWDIRNWHRAPENDKPGFPQNLDYYVDKLSSRQTGQQYGNIYHLYFDARPGDVIVVPVEGGFASYLMIGEVLTDFDPRDHQRLPMYGNDSVPFRRVRWINRRQLRRFLSPELAGELAGRRAIRLLAGEQEDEAQQKIYAEVFELSYRNFIYDDLCELVFDAPDYQNKALDIFPGAELLSAIIGYGNAVSLGNSIVDLPISDASDSDFAVQGVEVFEVDFGSPGTYRVKMRGHTPVLLMAGALIATLAAGFTIGEMKPIQVTNTTPIPVDIMTATRDLAERVIDSTGVEKLRELGSLERRARERIGFHGKPRATR